MEKKVAKKSKGKHKPGRAGSFTGDPGGGQGKKAPKKKAANA